MGETLLAIAIILSICLPAAVAVVGAVWYQRLVWQQYYGLKAVEEASVPPQNSLEEEEEVALGRKPNQDRRPRDVLLVGIESLDITDPMWRTEHVADRQEAMQVLRHQRYDLIVIPLDETSGEFFRWCAEQAPTTCRAVQCDEESPTEVFSVAPDAHLFLRRASPPATLQEQLTRGTSLDVRAIEEALSRHVGNLANLPALPATFGRLQKELVKKEVALDRVSEIIGRDLGLSAKVLQLVNAALVNTRNPVVQAEHAVKLVGLRGIRDLTLSVEVLNELAEKAPHLNHYLEESHLRSLRAAKLATRIMGAGAEADDAYSACLFHDIGRITLKVHAPEAYSQVELLHRNTKRPLDEIEMEILGVTHEDVSAYMLRLWGMPNAVVEAVQFWRNPTEVQHFRFTVIDAVHVAMHLVLAFEGGDIRKADFDADLLVALHRDRSINRWQIYAATICEDVQALPTVLMQQRAS